MLKLLAAEKCPSSWIKITNANTDNDASGEVIDDGSDGKAAAVVIVDEDKYVGATMEFNFVLFDDDEVDEDGDLNERGKLALLVGKGCN